MNSSSWKSLPESPKALWRQVEELQDKVKAEPIQVPRALRSSIIAYYVNNRQNIGYFFSVLVSIFGSFHSSLRML